MQQRYRLRPILNVTITGALWGEHVPKTPFGNGRVQCSGQPDATITHTGGVTPLRCDLMLPLL